MKNLKDKEEFIMTGRFMDVRKFAAERPNVELHEQCTDVVTYAGGHFVQLLKDGTYFVKDVLPDETIYFACAKLVEAEEKLWEKALKKIDDN
jgi:hypothetical protein